MSSKTTSKPAVRLRRIFSIRTVALKALVFGLVGYVAGPLLVIVSEPIGDLSELGATVMKLSLGIGLMGMLVLFVIQFIECPFCKKFFFFNWVHIRILRDKCVNCGRGV